MPHFFYKFVVPIKQRCINVIRMDIRETWLSVRYLGPRYVIVPLPAEENLVQNGLPVVRASNQLFHRVSRVVPFALLRFLGYKKLGISERVRVAWLWNQGVVVDVVRPAVRVFVCFRQGEGIQVPLVMIVRAMAVLVAHYEMVDYVVHSVQGCLPFIVSQIWQALYGEIKMQDKDYRQIRLILAYIQKNVKVPIPFEEWYCEDVIMLADRRKFDDEYQRNV